MNRNDPRRVAAGLALSIALAAIVLWGHRWMVWGPLLHARTWLAGTLPLITFWGPAEWLLARLGNEQKDDDPFERIVYAAFLSLALAALAGFIIITLHAAYPLTFLSLSAASIVLGRRGWADRFHRWRTALASSTETSERLPLAFLVIFTLELAAAASTPPLWYDTLEYHLPAPMAYLQHGGWIAFPYNVYAAFPMNVEMIYLWPLSAASAAGCKVVVFWMTLISAGAAYAIARRWGLGRNSAWAPATLLGTGLVLRIVMHGKVDLAPAMSAAVLWLAYERYRETPGRAWGVLIGAAMGFALGAKYLSAICILFPFIVSADDVTQSRERNMLARALAWCALGGVVFCLPWLIRNQVFYGNPVYPLLTERLGGSPPIFSALFAAAHARPDTNAVETVTGFLHKLFAESSPAGFSVLWLVTAPFWIRGAGVKRVARAITFCFAAWLAWFFLTQRNDRFLAPILPFMALAPAVALYGLKDAGGKRTALAAVCGVLLTVQAWSALPFVWGPDQAAFLISPTLDEAYLAKRMPHFRAIQFLNELKARAPRRVGEVLFVGEAQTYGAEFDFIAPTVFNHHPLETGLPAGVTHVLYNQSELNRLTKGYGPLGWPLGGMLHNWIVQRQADGTLKTVYDDAEYPGVVIVFEVRR
ncbi:MAG: hypothetical protein GC154_06345 [bacterium]|nr:hypothetical protein [bacterium]